MTVEKSYFVYIAQCSDGSLYAGYTVDVHRRMAAHNRGLGGKYTRSHLPVKEVYVEECPTKSAALTREAQIKKLTRKKKLALIETSAASVN